MFSWFSDIIHNYSEYQNPCIRRIFWNTATTYKIGTKALSAILDAMKLIRSPLLILVQNMILMTILTSRVKGRWPVLFTHEGACSNLARFY